MKSKIKEYIKFLPGPKISKKLLIFESDDWGSIRIGNAKAFQELRKSGVKVEEDPYCLYDNLANHDDLDALFSLLLDFRDESGNSPAITANVIVANPDFAKIKESNYQEYHYETIDKTFSNHSETSNALKLWKKGFEEGVFYPQFHGREHVNIKGWLQALNDNRENIIKAFNLEVFGIPTSFKVGNRNDFMAALDFSNEAEAKAHNDILTEGLNIFHELFGYRSESFIAPCYTWGTTHEELLSTHGVRILQGIPVQMHPRGTGKNYKRKYHYFAQKNKLGQFYNVRNAFFEPSLENKSNTDIVEECLNRIRLAFKYNKPAVVGVHRLNFIGSRDIRNRDQNLKLLRLLLEKVQSEFPDVFFAKTTDLIDYVD